MSHGDPRLTTASPRAVRTLHAINRVRRLGGCGTDYLILTACASADVYLSDVLVELVRDWKTSRADELALMLHKAAGRGGAFPDSWPPRVEWLSALTSGAMSPSRQSWQHMRLLLNVRNGLAHAEGELTHKDRGKRTPTLLRDIPRVLDIGFVGYRFDYGAGSAGSVVKVVRDFVLDIDDAVATSHPMILFP